jgi:hypothetical protein
MTSVRAVLGVRITTLHVSRFGARRDSSNAMVTSIPYFRKRTFQKKSLSRRNRVVVGPATAVDTHPFQFNVNPIVART